MDWRPDHGEPGWPTFLYAVPLGGGAVLLEETSLARRPGLPLPVLRRRLHARLARHGITAPADARVERVRFPVDRPRHARPACSASAPPHRSCTRPPGSAWPTRCGSPRPSPTRWPTGGGARRARRCGPPAPSRCTGCGGSAWRPCCACPPRRCRASSRPSSPCPTRTAAPTCPAATTSPATSPRWAPCSAAPTAAARPARRPAFRRPARTPAPWADLSAASLASTPGSRCGRYAGGGAGLPAPRVRRGSRAPAAARGRPR